MGKMVLKLYDVVGGASLPEIAVEQLPSEGDPVEINGDMYFVCERNDDPASEPKIGLIPLVVRNPSAISNIKQYIDCLSVAHRKVQFRNRQGITDLENSDEMIIS